MLRTDWVSYSPPMNTWTATARGVDPDRVLHADRDLLVGQLPQDAGPAAGPQHDGRGRTAGGMVERTMPRVVISASAYGSSGTIDRSTRSRPVVGPWK